MLWNALGYVELRSSQSTINSFPNSKTRNHETICGMWGYLSATSWERVVPLMLADLAAFALDSFAPELRRLAGGIATNSLARISFLDLKMLQDKPQSQQKFHTKSEATQITGLLQNPSQIMCATRTWVLRTGLKTRGLTSDDFATKMTYDWSQISRGNRSQIKIGRKSKLVANQNWSQHEIRLKSKMVAT